MWSGQSITDKTVFILKRRDEWSSSTLKISNFFGGFNLVFFDPGPASLVIVVVVSNTISLSNSRLRSAGKEEKMNDEERKRKTREYA